jgi:hypothetical protein
MLLRRRLIHGPDQGGPGSSDPKVAEERLADAHRAFLAELLNEMKNRRRRRGKVQVAVEVLRRRRAK